MAVDFAGGGKDDTAIVMIEHDGSQRYLRYREVVTDSKLRAAGVRPANARNPSAVAKRIQQLYQANNVSQVVTDATNIGEGFDSEIRETIGRGINSFNFSDREAVEKMMGNVNYGLHNGHIALHPDDTLEEQLLAIVKDKRKKGSTPRFSGKQHAPNGKDDLAIAFALAAYPPNMKSGETGIKQGEGNQDALKAPENDEAPDDDFAGSLRVEQTTDKTIAHSSGGKRSKSRDSYSRDRRRGRRNNRGR
jgi:hypothetical protein